MQPLLYEHFRDREDLLTQIAVDELGQLEARLIEKLPSDHRAAVSSMVERYWTFMLEHTQLLPACERYGWRADR
jgi:AcrR family transcriptional regulator